MKINKSSTLILGFCLAGLISHHAVAANFNNNVEKIVFTDASAVLKADLASGGPAVVAQGAKLVQPFGICVSKGEYFVSDTSWFAAFEDTEGNQVGLYEGTTATT